MIGVLRLGAVGMVLAMAACSNPPSSVTDEPSGPAAPTPSVEPSVVIGDPGSPLSLRPPGRPFDAEDILTAMRDSRRPGGVAEELQTDAIAAAVADTIWTLQGDPWDTISTAGACEGAQCTLELAGSATGDAGEDVWVLAVDPATAEVTVIDADLHGIPLEAADTIDRLARSVEGGDALDGLLLTSVRWHAPPDDQSFALAYRSGDEEQSCSMDVRLDIVSLELTEVSASGC
jgi:hypothetical protein